MYRSIDEMLGRLFVECKDVSESKVISVTSYCVGAGRSFNKLKIDIEPFDGLMFSVGVEITFKESGLYHGGYIRRNLCVKTMPEILLWLKTNRARDEIYDLVQVLIKKFYKD